MLAKLANKIIDGIPLVRDMAVVQLHRKGILGMNKRNAQYISPNNARYLFPLVDDKLQTKKLAIENGVNVPTLLGVIDNQHDVSMLSELVGGLDSFCIKPAKGSGGKGILIIARREGDQFFRSNGQPISMSDIERHVSNILAGLFSLGGATDVAMMESLIVVEPEFKNYSYEGVPDIRVIVFRGVPVMAMMRLSCAASHGKANLHQGAVGVGIDMATGSAVNAVQRDKPVKYHPDTEQDLMQLNIPHWHQLLELACECADMTGLGYLGVDLVIDANMGPVLLELNARPGLSIQIANSAGLVPRLKAVEGLSRPERMSIKRRVEFAGKHFSAKPLL